MATVEFDIKTRNSINELIDAAIAHAVANNDAPTVRYVSEFYIAHPNHPTPTTNFYAWFEQDWCHYKLATDKFSADINYDGRLVELKDIYNTDLQIPFIKKMPVEGSVDDPITYSSISVEELYEYGKPSDETLNLFPTCPDTILLWDGIPLNTQRVGHADLVLTPETARHILKWNVPPYQREQVNQAISRYSTDMAENHFAALTTITFSSGGWLIDGLERVSAVAASDKPCPFHVNLGYPDWHILIFDQHSKRNNGQLLGMNNLELSSVKVACGVLDGTTTSTAYDSRKNNELSSKTESYLISGKTIRGNAGKRATSVSEEIEEFAAHSDWHKALPHAYRQLHTGNDTLPLKTFAISVHALCHKFGAENTNKFFNELAQESSKIRSNLFLELWRMGQSNIPGGRKLCIARVSHIVNICERYLNDQLKRKNNYAYPYSNTKDGINQELLDACDAIIADITELEYPMLNLMAA